MFVRSFEAEPLGGPFVPGEDLLTYSLVPVDKGGATEDVEPAATPRTASEASTQVEGHVSHALL